MHDSPAKDVPNAWLSNQLVVVNNNMAFYHFVLGVFKDTSSDLTKYEYFTLINPIESSPVLLSPE